MYWSHANLPWRLPCVRTLRFKKLNFLMFLFFFAALRSDPQRSGESRESRSYSRCRGNCQGRCRSFEGLWWCDDTWGQPTAGCSSTTAYQGKYTRENCISSSFPKKVLLLFCPRIIELPDYFFVISKRKNNIY